MCIALLAVTGTAAARNNPLTAHKILQQLFPAAAAVAAAAPAAAAAVSLHTANACVPTTGTTTTTATLVLLQVNKIRELPQHPTMIVTHTDAPELYVWNTQTQPNMTRDKVRTGGGRHAVVSC